MEGAGGNPQIYFFPLSLGKGEGDIEPVLSSPKEGKGFGNHL